MGWLDLGWAGLVVWVAVWGRASLDCGDVGISDWLLRGFGVLWRFRCLGVDFAYFCGLGVAVSSCGLDCFRGDLLARLRFVCCNAVPWWVAFGVEFVISCLCF